MLNLKYNKRNINKKTDNAVTIQLNSKESVYIAGGSRF